MAHLSVHYLTELPHSLAGLAAELPSGVGESNVLAIFGAADADTITDKTLRARYHSVGPKPLGMTAENEAVDDAKKAVTSCWEIWCSSQPVQLQCDTTTGGTLNSAHSADITMLVADVAISADLAAQTQQLYAAMFDRLQAFGHDHMLRIWNYLPGINQGAADAEHYRQFSLGRYQAYLEQYSQDGCSEDDFVSQLPAASAIGIHEPRLQIIMLASAQPGLPFENSRQVSAYHYPREYGPKSPSFARALLQTAPSADAPAEPPLVFVSGTASVVGHASYHDGDLHAQIDETLNNIKHLLTQPSLHEQVKTSTNEQWLQQHLATHDWRQPEALKVFCRHPQDVPAIHQKLQQALTPKQPIHYCHGDICRQELLLEIEAVYSASH